MRDAPRERLEFVVTDNAAGTRIDRFITTTLPDVGRRAAARWIARGLVRVDGSRVSKATALRPGQRVVVEPPAPDAARAEPGTELELCLVRPDLVVVNKPAGMPSVALRASDRGTLAGALLARFPEMASVGFGPREPGLVHRLDTFTSGLVVAARSEQSFRWLRDALESGQLVKRYLAIVAGLALPERGVIESRLVPHPKNRRKVSTLRPGDSSGRSVRSDYRVLERRGELSLVELSVGPAYRHQIRVQLASLDAPIVGDALYGGAPCPLLAPGRHALHASYMRAAGDGVAAFEVESPLPRDMRELFDEAR